MGKMSSLKDDIASIFKADLPWVKSECNILVTGATGFIGGLLLIL
jgi:hypothetical protein